MPDYETTLNTPIQLGDALPADHLARFVVDIISQLDLSKIYAGYAERGGEAIAPAFLRSDLALAQGRLNLAVGRSGARRPGQTLSRRRTRRCRVGRPSPPAALGSVTSRNQSDQSETRETPKLGVGKLHPWRL